MNETLIGRDAERGVLATFVAASASGSAGLEIEGEPGIGKTTLFGHALELARASGSTVLECRPTVAESSMSFAGLTDLLRFVPVSAFGALPDPQRRALDIARLREAPASEPQDERAVGTGFATLIAHLADSHSLLIAIDDLQWLDQSSASVVTFAVRRLGLEHIGVLTSCRTGANSGRIVPSISKATWRGELRPTGLSSAAIFHIIRDRLGVKLTRPALATVSATSGGNPFAAIELARTAIDSSKPTSHFPTGWLESLTSARIAKLSADARSALLATACSPQPTRSKLAALGMAQALDEAETAGAISIDGDRIVFAHPLLAAAVVDLASPAQHRAMHAVLAPLAVDVESRARHAAMADAGPNETTASLLDEATIDATRRGASAAAAELAQLALERTPNHDAVIAWTRRIGLAELLHAAGSTQEAALTLRSLVDCPAPDLRARGLLLLTEVAWQAGTAHEAVGHAAAALEEARGFGELELRCLLSCAAVAQDNHQRASMAVEATALIAQAGISDSTLLAWAACERVSAQFNLGQGLDQDALADALRLERAGRTWRSSDQVATIRPALLKWADLCEESLASLHELRTRAEEEGNEGVIPYILGHIPGTLLRLGRFGDAAAAAAEHRDFADVTGQDNQRVQALYNVALVDAHLGRLQEARSNALSIIEWTAEHGDEWLTMSAASVLGFTALSAGHNAEARQWFDTWSAAGDELQLVDPGISRFYGDHIEALMACGAVDEARERTQSLERRASVAGRTSAASIAARCRALIAASTGDHTAAFDHIDRSLALNAQTNVPFERARTMLLKGRIHRRNKQKAAAQHAIGIALQDFESLEAASWITMCQQELSRVGTRTTDPTALTVTERSIAVLAGSGLTTRQVAEQSFVSPKTVEANLARIYRKLSVSSRAELGAHMQRLVDES